MTVKEFLRMADATTQVAVYGITHKEVRTYDPVVGDVYFCTSHTYGVQEVVSQEEYIKLHGAEKVRGFWSVAENVIGICTE